MVLSKLIEIEMIFHPLDVGEFVWLPCRLHKHLENGFHLQILVENLINAFAHAIQELI